MLITRVLCFFHHDSESQSVGSYGKRKYEISREAKLLALRTSLINWEEERVETAKRRAWNAQQPIHKLPNEVLSEIFILSASPIHDCLWRAPFLATCRRWRKCAIQCPQLWSVVHVGYCTELDELALCLSRSISCPLHVRFRYSLDDSSFEKVMTHFTAAYHAISSHRYRLRSLCIKGIPSIATLIPFEFPTYSFRELRLWWDTPWQPATPCPLVHRDVPPTIRVLDVWGPKVCRDAVHIENHQLSNLTTLIINQVVTVDSVRKVLPRCQSLKELRWLYVDEEVSPASGKWTMRSFSLPELETLRIHGSISVPLVEACDMPELRTLSITRPTRPMRDIVPHLVRCRRICEIELYSVFSTEEEDLVAIFENLQELTYFSCDTWTPSNLRGLRTLNEYSDDCPDGAKRLYCPFLTQLVVDGVRSKPRWDRQQELLEETLARYLKPLLRRWDNEYKPLTIYLPSVEGFSGLWGVDGVEFGENNPLVWD